MSRYAGNHRPVNLLPIHGDGEIWTVTQIPENSLDKIFLLYPNPYHKKSQQNLRWHNRPFMGELLKKLKKNGEIELRTNIKEYFIEAEQKLKVLYGLEIFQSNLLEPSPINIHQAITHFEKKYLERGETCLQGIWRF